MSDFKADLNHRASLISRAIPHYIHGDLRLAEIMRYGVEGGKCLRGACVMAISDAYGVSQDKSLPVAVAIECLQAYSLIHDDLPCMDDSDLRRGQPSAHKKFDEASALLAGDGLLTLSFEIMANADIDPNVCIQIMRAVSHAVGYRGMVLGQMMDLSLEHKAVDSFDDILHVGRLKTGVFYGVSCAIGAILEGSPESDQGLLTQFGEEFGVCFQAQDDYLDRYGHEQDAGKNLRNDLDKKTVAAHLSQSDLKEFLRQRIHSLDNILSRISVNIPFLSEMIRYNLHRRM